MRQPPSDFLSDARVQGVIDGAYGALAPSEAECVLGIVDDSFNDEASNNGVSVFEAALVSCVDPSIDFDVPFEGRARPSVVNAFRQEGYSDVQAECLVDELADAGFDVRDLGISDEPDPSVGAAIDAASCLDE